MNKADFYFDLPAELVAQYPLPNRTDSRLLVYHKQTKTHEHRSFKELAEFLVPGDLLVMNNTKVLPARLFGVKSSGGRVELLLERMLGPTCFLAHIKASKALKPGMSISLEKGWTVTVTGRHDDLFECTTQQPALDLFQEVGHLPLPPYIKRADEVSDKERYQTVYADPLGSVAAPTAGLHFDPDLLNELRIKGIEIAFTTLHVGAGTFRPVRCEDIRDHTMHSECYIISQELADAVAAAKKRGSRVIAVGTTALRSLESAATDHGVAVGERETSIFIYPGYTFKVCDGLITNFHLPESTLLMLVAAWIGHAEVMSLYQQAIASQYRFFSYGDACLLL